MTERDDQPAETPAAPEAPAPVDEAEVLRRTGLGITRWLQASVLLFWAALIGVVVGRLRDADTVLVLSLYALPVALVVSLILYLSIILEPVTFQQRRVRVWLAVSYGDLMVLSLLRLAIVLFTGARPAGVPVMALLSLAGLLASVGLLVFAYRRHNRFIFLAALLLLLGVNMLPG